MQYRGVLSLLVLLSAGCSSSASDGDSREAPDGGSDTPSSTDNDAKLEDQGGAAGMPDESEPSTDGTSMNGEMNESPAPSEPDGQLEIAPEVAPAEEMTAEPTPVTEPEPVVAQDSGVEEVSEPAVDIGDTPLADAEVEFVGEGVPCGAESCQDPLITFAGQMIQVDGCCASEDQCGVDMSAYGVLVGIQMPGCEPLGLTGSTDEGCPSSMTVGLSLLSDDPAVFPGCCQANGQCGYDASIQGLGFGCMSPTRFGEAEGADCMYTGE